MFCNYLDIYYRYDTDKLQSAVDHSDKEYQCQWMSDCPYTGTTLIKNIPWAGQAGAEQEEDQAGNNGETEEGDGRLTSRPRQQED